MIYLQNNQEEHNILIFVSVDIDSRDRDGA